MKKTVDERERERERVKRKRKKAGTVVVAQLVERLLPTQKVRGSNPVIGKTFISNIFVFCQLH